MLMLLVAVPVSGAYAVGTVSGTAPDEVPVKAVASGTVIDKATGEPVIGANVALWSGGKLLVGTSTDYKGEFKIASPVKEFELQVSFIGYKTVTFDSKNGALVNLRVELSEDSNLLDDVW